MMMRRASSATTATSSMPAAALHTMPVSLRVVRAQSCRHDMPGCSNGGHSDFSGSTSSTSGAWSRRAALAAAAAAAAAAGGGLVAAHAAVVAPTGLPLVAGGSPGTTATGLTAAVRRALPPFSLPFSAPEPVRFPRKALDPALAVLLMRSSYDAMDALDFIARQDFEARFWKLRQSQVEAYNLQYAPLRPRPGDLTDPLYFDFISFSQYATISKEMSHPVKVFQEYYELCAPGTPEDDPCDSELRTVARPRRYEDDSLLPSYFYEVAGDLIYAGLRDGFRGRTFGGPPPAPPGASSDDLAAGAGALLRGMADAGYALRAEVSATGPGGFTVSLTGPCNLWALRALGSRGAAVVNAYDVLALDSWLRASGRSAAVELELTESGVNETWTLMA